MTENPFRDDPLLRQLTILGEREGLIEAYVPLTLIDTNEVPVNQMHVGDLARSMRLEASKTGLGTGQLVPVLLAHLSGLLLLSIIDGYHRVSARVLNGENDVYSTIKPDCTPDDVTDTRILSASDSLTPGIPS